MRYQVTAEDKHKAKNPHHIFNINIILTHLAISQVSLEIGHGNPLYFLLVPIISSIFLGYIYFHGQKVAANNCWFVGAHWVLAWRRGRNLLIAYGVAIMVILLATLLGNLFGGGLMMNDFSEEGGSSSIVEKIGLFFGALVVFFTVLYNFLQTGISVYDAGKGIIDPKIANYHPRDAEANEELGEGTDSDKLPENDNEKSS